MILHKVSVFSFTWHRVWSYLPSKTYSFSYETSIRHYTEHSIRRACVTHAFNKLQRKCTNNAKWQ